MKEKLFPKDIQSEMFVTMENSACNDSKNETTILNNKVSGKDLQEHMNMPDDNHYTASNEENATSDFIIPAYPLEEFYEDVNINSDKKEMADNSLHYNESEISPDEDIFESKSATEYTTIFNDKNTGEITRGKQQVNYTEVRILHAASNNMPIDVSIGGRKTAEKLPFGKISNYERIIDGYRTVLVTNSKTGILMVHEVLPFTAGTKVTLVINNTAGGIEVSRVCDDICHNKMNERSCFRIANFTFDDGPFDLALSNGSIVFNNVRMKEVTSFKQAVSGDYNFCVLDTMYNAISYNDSTIKSIDTGVPKLKSLEIMRVFADENKELSDNNLRYINSKMTSDNNYIFNFFVKMNKNTLYTSYIIGGQYPEVPLQIITVEN